MSKDIQPVRGTKDLLGEDYYLHRFIIEESLKIAERYGYTPLATPIMEFTSVFARTLGDTSDVVSKEMYSFIDRGENSITLRPEFTAGVVRSVISNKLTHDLPIKFFSAGPLFRYERPQEMRQRQFHQINFESIGTASPFADCEVIALAVNILSHFGILDLVRLELNSLGDSESRLAYKQALIEYFHDYKNDLSEDSQRRLEKNPMRILDSKDENDKKIVQSAPRNSDYFNDLSKEHFAKVQAGLDALGISYKVNPLIVRGLDYYCHTTFEFITDKLGAQGTVLGGGRYDGLAEMMGGPHIPGLGFASGIERLAGLMEYKHNISRETVLIAIDIEYMPKILAISEALRNQGVVVRIAYEGNVGKAMKKAAKNNAKYAIFVGEDEIKLSKYKCRDLDSGEEVLLSVDDIAKWMERVDNA